MNGQKVWTSGAHQAGVRARDRAYQPRRAEARGHHHDGHRHARRGRRGAAAADDHRHERVQRGVLQRRVHPRRRRGRSGRRRLDRRARHARQRERVHRRRPGWHAGGARRSAAPRRSTRTPNDSAGATGGSAATSRPVRRWRCSTCAARTARSRAASPGPEGNVTKLVLSENGHEAAAILAALGGPETAFLDGAERHERDARPVPPRHVDRGRHVGDQAQPDRRAASSACRATR